MHMKRLFDCLDHQLAHFPKQDMLAAKEKGVWTPYSTANVAATVNKLSAGLLSLGISGKDFTPEGSDKIAIMSGNRPEWVFTDLACQQIGAILVPLYPTTNPIEVEFILNDAAVGYIFVSNLELYEKVKAVASKVPSIKGIFTFDTITAPKHKTVRTPITIPTDTTCRVRFANFAYNGVAETPAIDIVSLGKNEIVATNVRYTDVTDFIVHPSRIGTEAFQIRLAGTTTVLATSTVSTLLPQRMYTVVYRGSHRATSGTSIRAASLVVNY